MKDRFNRKIDYLRVSITDRCNLRCIYCMPAEGVRPIEHRDILRYEEMVRIVRIAAGYGITNVRLTGGEPLVRKGLPTLIKAVREIDGIKSISLTTNGVLLKGYAHILSSSGLDRINISLDSLRPDRYREITRGGSIAEVWQGIEEAEKAGLNPIKINVVPIKGFNDDEIIPFAQLTIEKPYHVRFIEFMPIGPKDIWERGKCIPCARIKSIVQGIGRLEPVKGKKAGPAVYYRLEGARGLIGFISPISNHFCSECNRIRLTADGKLRPCLFSDEEIDLKTAMQNGASDEDIGRILEGAVFSKPKGHGLDKRRFEVVRPMSRIGG